MEHLVAPADLQRRADLQRIADALRAAAPPDALPLALAPPLLAAVQAAR